MVAREIAEEHIRRAEAGLDLADEHERAVFRQRLADSFHMTRVSFIREQARALGLEPTGAASRRAAVRLIADAHIAGVWS